jgi:DNA-directed RNA polymerase specialized sigma24 family protein
MAGLVVSFGVDDAAFGTFVAAVRPRLARAFIASYGVERGQEAVAESLAYAWEHFEAIRVMANPAGYLFRVGQSRTRPRRTPVLFPAPEAVGLPWVEPALPAALASLSDQQRVCVVLVHGYRWTQREVADLLGVAPTTVQNHVERGLDRLRRRMEVVADA